MLSKVGKIYGETALIKLIAAGLVVGIFLAVAFPASTRADFSFCFGNECTFAEV